MQFWSTNKKSTRPKRSRCKPSSPHWWRFSANKSWHNKVLLAQTNLTVSQIFKPLPNNSSQDYHVNNQMTHIWSQKPDKVKTSLRTSPNWWSSNHRSRTKTLKFWTLKAICKKRHKAQLAIHLIWLPCFKTWSCLYNNNKIITIPVHNLWIKWFKYKHYSRTMVIAKHRKIKMWLWTKIKAKIN
jgi:hypothetical protein